MAESTIKVSMQGVDNASNVIKKVKGQLEGLGVAANQQAAQMSKGGDAIRAAMGAAQGSISGALGAAKGMTQAIQGMGVAMSTALPVAALVATAIYGIAKAVEAHKKAQKEAADQIRVQNDILAKQADTVGKLAAKYKELASYRQRMSDLQASIDGETPTQRNQRQQGLAAQQLGDIRAEKDAVLSEMDKLRAAIADNLAKVSQASVYFVGDKAFTKFDYSEEERKAFAESAEKLAAERKKLTERYSALVNDEKLQEMTVKALAAEGDRLSKEMAATKWSDLMKRMSAGIKEWADGQKKLLTEERTGLLKQLNQLKSLAGPARMSNLYSAGSHSTNLLLDRLNGGDSDSTTAEVATNVKTITDRLTEIERLMEQLQAI